MAINFIEIELDNGSITDEHEQLNAYLLTGWAIIGHSTYDTITRFGETNDESEKATYERYTLFKPDHTIGESADTGIQATEDDDNEETLTILETTRGYDVVDEQNEMVYLRNATREKAEAFLQRANPTPQGEIALGIVASEDGTPEAGSDSGVYSLQGTMLVADAIHALARQIEPDPSPKTFAAARTEIERYTANHELAFEPHHCKDCNRLSGDYTTAEGIFCETCYDKRYGFTPATPADSVAEAGYRLESTPIGCKLYAPSGGFMCHVDADEIMVFEDILNAETRTLREQVARLQAELAGARERVVIRDARINQMQPQMDSIADLARKGLNTSHDGIVEDVLKTIRRLAEND